MWEAFEHAAFTGLDNLTAIIDVNRLGQTRETMVGWDLDRYVKRAPRRSAGTRSRSTATTSTAIDAAYAEARETTGKPTVIVARRRRARASRRSRTSPASTASRSTTPRRRSRSSAASATSRSTSPRPTGGREPHALRRARRRAADLGRSARRSRPARPTARRSPRSASMRGDVVALDGEVSNSTHSEMFREAHADRYFEMFIAEQQMVAAAVGMQVRDWVPFASTFAAFLSRAYDFVRMAAISRATSASRARTPASRSARTARRRWRSRTSRRSARSTAAACCTRPTPTRRRSSSPRWPTARASPSCARCAARPRCARRPTRT